MTYSRSNKAIQHNGKKPLDHHRPDPACPDHQWNPAAPRTMRCRCGPSLSRVPEPELPWDHSDEDSVNGTNEYIEWLASHPTNTLPHDADPDVIGYSIRIDGIDFDICPDCSDNAQYEGRKFDPIYRDPSLDLICEDCLTLLD